MSFSNIKKSVVTNLKKEVSQFFADHLFQMLKKYTCKSLKNLANSLLTVFSNIKKSILTNLKKT